MESVVLRLKWHVEHRLEYLDHRLVELRAQLEPASAQNVDFEVLREYFEVRGRIRELRHLLEHAEFW